MRKPKGTMSKSNKKALRRQGPIVRGQGSDSAPTRPHERTMVRTLVIARLSTPKRRRGR